MFHTAAATDEAGAEEATSVTRDATVFVVDDNAAVRKSLRRAPPALEAQAPPG